MSMLDDRPHLDEPVALDALDDVAPITDDELTALALAADPDQPIDPDAVPLAPAGDQPGLLPAWYMPAASRVTHKRWHKVLVIAAIIGFVAINAFGFCITYGLLEQA